MHKNLPKARFSATLNGLIPDRADQMVHKIVKDNPNLVFESVGISLNGPEEIHDKSRGVPGSFKRAIKTYHLIKDVVPVRFSFTYLPYNTEYFEWVQEFAKKLGTSAYLCWTVMNDRFDSNEKELEFFQEGIKEKLRQFLKDKNFAHRLVMSYLYDNFIQRKCMQCNAARQFFHLDPEGNVYPCNFKLSKDRIIGNVKQKSLKNIWAKADRQRVLKEIDSCECIYQNGGPCGDSDLSYSNYNNLTAVLWWYFKKGLKSEKLIK